MAFNPSKHIPLSKSLATISFPMVAQSYFYDETLFVYRPYINVAEVDGYIGIEFRNGSYDIVINFGGSLSGGVVTGGLNKLYWYDNDGVLKPKGGSQDDPLTFTQADLVLVYEDNYSLSFDLPDGKSVATIETKSGTVTKNLTGSMTPITDTANSPNTIISGFDNNAAQTITIKLI